MKMKSIMQKKRKFQLIIPLVFLLIVTSSCINQDKKRGEDISTDKGATIPEIEILPLPKNEKREIIVDDYEAVLDHVDKWPEFPGDPDAPIEYMKENLQYPEEAKDKGIAGRVICQFIVLKDGTISDVEVIRGVHPLLDAEAVRVLESMPKWKPGVVHGRTVKVRVLYPVTFRHQR